LVNSPSVISVQYTSWGDKISVVSLADSQYAGQMTKEGRRSPRIVARIPLDVEPILESVAAATAVINLHGALILSPVPWPSGTALNMRNPKTDRSIRARVVWTGPGDGTGIYKLGVEFEDAESGFWGNDYRVAS
jgi:PilZ domain